MFQHFSLKKIPWLNSASNEILGASIVAIWSFPLFLLLQIIDPSLKQGLGDLSLLLLFAYLFRRRQPDFRFGGGWLSFAIGILVVLLSLAKISSLFWFEPEFIPLGWWLINLGLILILLGFKQVIRFWRSLLLVSLFLAPIKPVLGWIFDLRIPTAIAATFGLHYLGVDVSRNASLIFSKVGAVDVNQGCTAIELLTLTYRLVILIGLAFSLSWMQWLKIHLVSFGIPFLTSILRVMLLAVIVNNRPAFTYWHIGGGGNWFALFALLATTYAWIKILGNFTTEKFQLIQFPSLSQLHKLTLVFLATISVVLFTSSLVNPTIARRDVAPYQFPLELANSTSSQEITEIAAPKSEAPPTDLSDRFHSGRSYLYEKNQDKNNQNPITVELRYLVGTKGDLSDRQAALFEPKFKPELESNSLVRKIKQADLAGIGSYQFWQSNQNLHLSTCLFSDRTSRIKPISLKAELQDSTQFSRDFTNWLLGRTPLRDRRCIWVHGFTSLSNSQLISSSNPAINSPKESRSDSPVEAAVDAQVLSDLVAVWQNIYAELVNQFPSIN